MSLLSYKRLCKLGLLSVAIICVLYAVFVAIMRFLDIAIGIDFQNEPCIGRVFIYSTLSNSDVEQLAIDELVALRLKVNMPPFRKNDLIIKKVIGKSGDKVSISSDSTLVVDAAGRRFFYGASKSLPINLTNSINFYLYSDQIFLYGDSPYAIDSRLLGPISASKFHIYTKVIKIW